jgi:hypothetical protein
MKNIYIKRIFSFIIFFAILFAPLPLTSIAENIVDNLSEIEREAVLYNRNTIYIYLGEELSDIKRIVTSIKDLDYHKKSPIIDLSQHIETGFLIGRQDAILDALHYAELVLQDNIKKHRNNDYAQQLCKDLQLLMNKIISGELVINIQAAQCDDQEHNQDSLHDMLVHRGPGDFVIDNNLKVLGKTLLKKHLHTKQGAHIEGKLEVDKKALFKNRVIIKKLLSAAMASIANLTVQQLLVTNPISSLTVNQLSATNAVISGTLSASNAIIANFVFNDSVSFVDTVIQNSTILDSLTLSYVTQPGILHNNGSGGVTSSLIINNDITNGTITNSKLATVSSTATPGSLVAYDGSGNFTANMITITGTPTNPTDVATKAYVDAQVGGGGGTNLNMPNTVVKRDNTGSFATQVISMTDAVISNSATITPFNTAGIIHNDPTGLLSSSLIVDADITPATITNDKLATVSSAGTPGNLVVYDGSGHFTANGITITGTPVNPTDAATVAYVNSTAGTGIVAKTPAVVVATADIGSPPAGLQTIDGITLAVNNRVLLVGQSNAIQNGLWLAQPGNWTRPSDFATGTPAQEAYVLITSGTMNGGSSWLCNTPNAIIDTDPIGFAEFSLPSQTTGANIGVGTGLVFANVTGLTLNFRSLIAGSHITITNNPNDITLGTDAINTDTPGTIVARDGSGNFTTNMITIDGTTTNPTDVATKAYVDSVAGTGIVAKNPAVVVSTTDIGTPPAGLQTIDGVTVADSDRVLLVGQTNAVENGLWLAHAGNWTRPADFATGTQAQEAYVLITSGTMNGGSSWLCNTPNAIIDTDPIGFAEFSLPSQTNGANIGSGTGLVFANTTGLTLNFRSLIASNHIIITNNANDITLATDGVNTDSVNTLVARDGSGNFTTNMITIDGTTTNPTDVATKAYVDAAVTAGGTNLDTPNTLVLRDNTGSFAAQVVSMTDGVHSGNLILTTEPSTSTAGNILKGSSSFIHDFGTNNTFVGINAGNFTTSGLGGNTAVGNNALNALAAGTLNTALGIETLQSLTTGAGNIGIGNLAGSNCTGNESFNIYIASSGVAAENNTIRIGGATQNAAYITGISGATTLASAVPVVVDTNNKLGTNGFYQTQTTNFTFNASASDQVTPQGSPNLSVPVEMTRIGNIVIVKITGQSFTPTNSPTNFPVTYVSTSGLPTAFRPTTTELITFQAFTDVGTNAASTATPLGGVTVDINGIMVIWSQIFVPSSLWQAAGTGWYDIFMVYLV